MPPQFNPSSLRKGDDRMRLKDAAPFEAAAAEIKELIDREGGVDAYRYTQVINEKVNIARLVERHFPGALSSAHILEQIAPVIEKRGYTAGNTLFAQSVCPDEINHEEGDITDLLTKHLGEVFHLGGLGGKNYGSLCPTCLQAKPFLTCVVLRHDVILLLLGIPFAGKTGFGAYAHHVPNDGHCFVMMAPHVGLDNSCNLGKYSRDGQTCSGAACGAAVGAFNHCCSGKAIPSLHDSPDDYQMVYLMHRINQRKERILKNADNNSKQAALASETHDIAKELLDTIVNVDFGGPNSTLVVLTGVQINMPRPFDDFFQPLNFYILDKEGTKIDLFHETFGPPETVESTLRRKISRGLPQQISPYR